MLDNQSVRQVIARFINPIARLLLRFGMTADQVTWIGAIGTSLAAIIFIAHGNFGLGTFLIVLLSGSDLLDGTMARISGTSGKWGAFLDSTLDRFTDFALIGSLSYYFAEVSHNTFLSVAALASGGLALITSYIRARAESVGATCTIGLIERAERLTLIQTSCFIAALGFVDVFRYTIPLLVIGSAITVAQRITFVRKQLKVSVTS